MTYYLIVLDRPTASERAAVHEIVKRDARSWWHRFANAWIAGGRDADYWMNAIAPMIPEGRSSVLVAKLPEKPDDRDLAYYGIEPEVRIRWLEDKLGP